MDGSITGHEIGEIPASDGLKRTMDGRISPAIGNRRKNLP